MSDIAKIKKGKRILPLYIEYGVVLSYILSIFAGMIVIQLLVLVGVENTPNHAMVALSFLAPLTGFCIGWYIKLTYVKKQGDDDQYLRIKAQFWGAMAFVISLIVSLLLILMILIKLENSFLPDSLPEPIVFALSISILGLCLYIANQNKKRVYRNFGYM